MMSLVMPSEIQPMLASIREDGRKWLIDHSVVVFWDGDGWCIHEDWSIKNEGECVVFAHTNKEIIPEIKEYLYGG